jgi:putative ABC transport system permease protein
MQWLAEIWRRIQFALRRSHWENDLAEEMKLHVELRAAEREEDGASPREAAAYSHRRFGNLLLRQEDSRAVWGWCSWDRLLQDLRYGLRTLKTDRAFTAAAVLSLALGIGANTAIFNILNAVMLRTLQVEDPGRLVVLKFGRGTTVTNPIWEQVRDHQQAFSGALAFGSDQFDLNNGGESRLAQGLWVSGDFFKVLGVPALRGRVFNLQDDVHGGGRSGPVAVISYAFWTSYFAGDANVLGKTVRLDRREFQVIGVTPPWFKGLDIDRGYDVAIPIGCEPLMHADRSALNQRSWWWLRIIGRLAPEETPRQAEDRLNSATPEIVRATLAPNWPANIQSEYLNYRFSLLPASTGFSQTGVRYRKGLFTLMTIVGLVLLIACANIANLLLARGTARRREISIRMAIGASRARVIRQLLTESLLLSLAGAAGGLVFAIWGSRFLVTLLSTTVEPLEIDVRPDLTTLWFTAAVAVATGILFGLVPALRATSEGPNQALKERARTAQAGSSRFTLGKALVVGQVALSLTLLVGAGLFLGTLRNLLTIDPGFDRHSVLLVNAVVPEDRVPKAQRAPLFDRILAGVRDLPGVRSASRSLRTPITHWFWNDEVYPEGYQPKAGAEERLVYFNRVSPGYFGTLGTPLLMGRDFAETDNMASPKVMIVSEYTAHQFWGNANPIGKTIGMEGENRQREVYQVIGVVKDAKYADLNEEQHKSAFVPFSQDSDPRSRVSYEIRTDGSMEALAPLVRELIGRVNKDVSLEFRSLEVQVGESLVETRLVALLSTFFGIIALLLATIGLYGVIAYATARRRGEIGIRMALGAERRSVIWLVLRDVALVLSAGTILGVMASLAAGRLVASLLFGVRPADPITMTIAAVLLITAAGVAGYLPARRAAGMDPMAALREE